MVSETRSYPSAWTEVSAASATALRRYGITDMRSLLVEAYRHAGHDADALTPTSEVSVSARDLFRFCNGKLCHLMVDLARVRHEAHTAVTGTYPTQRVTYTPVPTSPLPAALQPSRQPSPERLSPADADTAVFTLDDLYPPEWICPLTLEVLHDPVVAPDGLTYERNAIEAWFQRSATSPLTGAVLASTDVRPNLTLTAWIRRLSDTPHTRARDTVA